jgi:hypothetical protein
VCVFLFFRKFEILKTPKVQSNDFIFFGGDDFKFLEIIIFEKYKKFYILEKYFLKSKKSQSNDFIFFGGDTFKF